MKECNDRKSKIRDLSLYIHIPFCKQKCVYCDFLSFGESGYDRQRQYISSLCKEIETYQIMAKDYLVKTIFIGGGTPSYIGADLIEKVMETVYKVFKVDTDAEITMEGNPDSLKRDKLRIYKSAGVNRLSIGLQSTNDIMLKTLGRVHDYDQFIESYHCARETGFQNINIDIMSGLPGDTEESFGQTLEKVSALKPEHISAYSLIVEEETPFSQNAELLHRLPSEEEDRAMYVRTKELLKASGYNRYEISNYAKEGFSCKHNIVYWTGGEYLGIGLGAASYLTVWLDQCKGVKVRFHGVENLEEYIAGFDSIYEHEYANMYHFYENNSLIEFWKYHYEDLYFLKRKDEMEEYMFLGLRLMKGISKEEFKERFGVTIESIYGKVINKYKEKKLLIEREGRIFLSDKGIDVSNVIMTEFML